MRMRLSVCVKALNPSETCPRPKYVYCKIVRLSGKIAASEDLGLALTGLAQLKNVTRTLNHQVILGLVFISMLQDVQSVQESRNQVVYKNFLHFLREHLYVWFQSFTHLVGNSFSLFKGDILPQQPSSVFTQ
jgi:hypothetical protein